VDYLKQHNLASAPALLVISRYLASRPEGVGEGELRRILQPRAMTPDRDRPSRGDVLAASLGVGEDLGLLEAQGTARDRRDWSLCDSLQDEVRACLSTDSRALRSLLLRCLGARALAAVDTGERPSDVALALIWLLLRDPLAPFSVSWGEGPEQAFLAAKLDTAVANAEQWRALLRWARSLGLATVTQAGRRESYLVIDPTTALQNALDRMPRRAPADQWFRHLHSLVPILGHPKLMAALPAAGAFTSEVPASMALAMQKIERAGRLHLVASDDARNAVVLRLGRRDRRISEVHVLEEDA